MSISTEIARLKETYGGVKGLGLPSRLRGALSNPRGSDFEVIQAICQSRDSINRTLYPNLFVSLYETDEVDSGQQLYVIRPFINLYKCGLLNEANVNKLIAKAGTDNSYLRLSSFLKFMQVSDFLKLNPQEKFDTVLDHDNWYSIVSALINIGNFLDSDVFESLLEHKKLDDLSDAFYYKMQPFLTIEIVRKIVEHDNPRSIYDGMQKLSERVYDVLRATMFGNRLMSDPYGAHIIRYYHYSQLPWVKENMPAMLTYPDFSALADAITRDELHQKGALEPFSPPTASPKGPK